MTKARLPPAARAAIIAIAAVGLQVLLVPLFAAPNARLNPHHLPIVVVGPAPAVRALDARLDKASPGGFDVRPVPDEAAADTALRRRDAYAAVLLGPPRPRLHLAGAAGQGAANLLIQASPALFGTKRVPTSDVVPPPSGDRHGLAFTLGFLPLVLTSIIAGAVLVLLVRSRPVRLAGLVGFGVLAGLASALVMHDWLHLVGGHYLPSALVLGLITVAISAAMAGLGAVAGRYGLVLGVLVMFFIGNALSGISSAPSMLPPPWGSVGQFLPPGAGGTLLRSVSSFHGYGGTLAARVLAAWAAAGLTLVAAGRSAMPPARAERPNRHGPIGSAGGRS